MENSTSSTRKPLGIRNTRQVRNEQTITPPILNLNLKAKWFDMILEGKKTVEYRSMSQYWRRIFTHNIKIKGKYYHPTDVVICFSNGYSKTRRQMLVQCEGLSVGCGLEELGSVKDVVYFKLKLGKIINFTI